MTLLLGAVLLVAGGWVAIAAARARPDSPPARWHPDPTGDAGRDRYWDGQAWTAATRDGSEPADRGRRFRGRFWSSRWIWPALTALIVLVVLGAAYLATGITLVLAALSLVVMALVCTAFYRWVERQLDLREVVSGREVIAIAVAAGGAVLLIALPLNDVIIRNFGLTVGLGTVGLVEEGTKLAVPFALYLLGRHRNPRAGIAAGLAGGFGFAVTETTLYGFTLPLGGAPDPCTGAALAPPGAVVSLFGQVYRMAFVSPMHWFWTGIAAAVIWRQWRLHGTRVNAAVLGALLLVVVTHSVNDSSAVWWCGAPPAAEVLHGVIGYASPLVLYLLFKFFARQSMPPQLGPVVSRGWQPTRLKTEGP